MRSLGSNRHCALRYSAKENLMHIADGLISAPLCIGGFAGGGIIVGASLRATASRDIPRLAVIGAAFFIASLIHFPVGIASVHLTLIGLTGIMLRGAAPPAIAAGLLFQALIFQHGGLSTLGVNICIHCLPALMAGLIYGIVQKSFGTSALVSSVTGAFVALTAVFVAAGLSYAVLSLSHPGLQALALTFSLSNALLGLIEGVGVFFAVNLILKIKPELLNT
ncbi:MAG: cobalamin biosynthesis protein CbiM [Chitinivibrionales bacterium]|nr:cobalamin biosynthesis protein CbiM [Chitinivibrionales bacterium]